ncbi:hypothetical protein BN6_19210 [Saccharothrix espanaensis DSM 44229]|uniref:Uncharacterized protein n=1 Tax=Saccharothrix espanaensis (strain ATCC 51144 / DSM 44229 / JCM 9112 / NBRC 15066 / NRRL 15764) TaxID=1179773 RepID=K0JTI6_SACES|nr:hypothetical protein BN6_19210 [Saccharothrix espanaensis DSM 44229]
MVDGVLRVVQVGAQSTARPDTEVGYPRAVYRDDNGSPMWQAGVVTDTGHGQPGGSAVRLGNAAVQRLARVRERVRELASGAPKGA